MQRGPGGCQGHGACGNAKTPDSLGFDNGGLGRGGGAVLGVAGLADVDAALEVGAVLDGDAGGGDVPGEGAFAADVDAVAGMDVAAHLAEHDDFAGGDVGGDLAVAADGDAVAGQADGAFDLAVDVERLGTGDLALDEERLADGGLFAAGDGGGGGGTGDGPYRAGLEGGRG